MISIIKKSAALFLLVTFPWVQLGISSESIQMVDGQLQPVADPFAQSQTTAAESTLAEVEDFLTQDNPLSSPIVESGNSRFDFIRQSFGEVGEQAGSMAEIVSYAMSLVHVYAGQDLQAAINAAEEGQTLSLHAGTYHGNFILKQGVHLLGGRGVILAGETSMPVLRALGNNRVERVHLLAAGLSEAILVEGENFRFVNGSIENFSPNQIRASNPSFEFQVKTGEVVRRYSGNQLREVSYPDSSKTYYNDAGALDFFVSADGTILNYSMSGNSLEVRDSEHSLIKTWGGTIPATPDLTGTVKRILPGGLEAYYIGDRLVEVRTITGVRIYDIVFTLPTDSNAEPEIAQAVIRYTDGSADFIWNKKLLRRIFSDGTIVDYLPDGTMAREIKGEVEQTYYSVYAAAGNLSGMRIRSSQGDETFYDEKGILRAVYGHDGKRFIYDRRAEGENWVTELNLELSTVPTEDALVRGKYLADGTTEELLLQDGRRLEFEGGALGRVTDAQNQTINYVTAEINGVMSGLTVSRDGAQFVYNPLGFLSEIRTSGGTIIRENSGSLNPDGSQAVNLLLELVGGDQLTDFVLDEDGNIVSGLIHTREGITQRIENGILTGYETADGRFYSYNHETGAAQLTSWTFSDGMVVKYGGTSITEILFPNGIKKWNAIELDENHEVRRYVEVMPDGTERHYENGRLQKTVFPPVAPATHGVTIEYERGLAVRVIRPEGDHDVIETIERVYDEESGVTQIRLTGADETRVYSPEGDLRALIVDGLEAEVSGSGADLTIEQISSRFGTVEAPVFNAQAQMSGNIELVDGRVLTVADGKLTRMVLADGTQIDYQDGRIARVENDEGVYILTYVMESGVLQDVKVNWELKNTEPVTELVTTTVPIVAEGDVRLASDVGKFGNYLSLDGNGDYLSLSDHPDWDLNGSFTIDFWTKFSTVPSNIGFIEHFESNGNAWRLIRENGKLTLISSAQSSPTILVEGDWVPQSGEWYHIVATYDETQNLYKLYVNGKQIAQKTTAAKIADLKGDLHIGWARNNQYFVNGYLDEVRLSTGTRWTSNFTVPSAESSADPDVLFLHHFDEIDSVEKAPVATVVAQAGNASIYAPQGVFNDAYYFDGNGDALKTYDSTLLNFGTADFTIDFRANFESIRDGQFQTFFSRENASDIRMARDHDNNLQVYVEGQYFNFGQFKPQTNRWYHFALVRKNGVLKLYVDGAASNAGIASNQNMQGTAPLYFGTIQSSDYFRGMMDEFRISDMARWDADFSVPAEAYEVDGHTRFLHHFDDGGRAEAGHEILKYGIEDAGEAMAGNVQVTAANATFGEAGLGFSSADRSFMRVPEINLEGSDYTVEGWFQAGTASLSGAGIWGQQNTAVTDYAGLYVDWDGKLTYEIRRNSQNLLTLKVNQTINFSQKHHFAVVKAGGVVKIFVDGLLTAQGTVSDLAMPDFEGVNFTLGRYSFSGYTTFYGWTGSVDEFRISDRARYAANFSVATQAFEVDKNTLFLHHGEGQGLRAAEDFNEVRGEMSLSRYLLENPDSGFAQIVASRSVHDILDETTMLTLNAGTASVALDLTAWAEDFDRGSVAAISGLFDPVLGNIDVGNSVYNNGLIGRGVQPRRDDDLAALVADLRDMDGDGDLDRIYVDPGFQHWWIQRFENGAFQNPEVWGGTLQLDTSDTFDAHYVMRGYEGRHPVVLVDLADVNGDNLPDRILSNWYEAEPQWQVQLNNGNGFDAVETWGLGLQPASQWNFQATYAIRVRDDLGGHAGVYSVQPLIADLIDLDGDGIADRVVRPYASPTPGADPYDHWFFQKGTGHGFEQTTIWTGIDHSFDVDAKTGGSLAWHSKSEMGQVDVGALKDLDGDGLPDRILMKHQNPNDANSAFDWYWQKNNGHGFEPAALWDSSVRAVVSAPSSAFATGMRFFSRLWDNERWVFSDLRDVTGDGRPDRITLDSFSLDQAVRHAVWYVEVNNGNGFDGAVAWEGIEGANLAQTSITQENSDFFAYGNDAQPYYTKVTSDLRDINGDNIADRIFVTEGSGQWRVQYGTGSGFLPSQPMAIQGMRSTADIISENYDNIHISFRAASIPAGATGKIQIRLLGTNNQEVQVWEIANPSTAWTDKYLALDQTKTGGRYLEVKWVRDAGSVAADPEILIEDIGFTSLRPEASTEWLDYLLTESAIVERVNAAANENLADYLGSPSGNVALFDWRRLFAVENLVVFDTETDQVIRTETLDGEISNVTYQEDVTVIRTTLPDGRVTEIQVPESSSSSTQTYTQTIHHDNNTPADITDDYTETATIAYGRIRSITRMHEGKSDLQYTYEFDELGREVTVIYDSESKETEKYRVFQTQNGEENRVLARIAANGVETRFSYNNAGDLIRTDIVYMGRVRETFTHGAVEDGLHPLITESGMTELYDDDGKLVAHITPEGYRYEHAFGNAQTVTTTMTTETIVLCDPATDEHACVGVPVDRRSLTVSIPITTLVDCTQGCTEVHQVTLASYTDEDGNKVFYNGAKITHIEFATGVKIDFDGFEEVETTDAETGAISIVRRPKDVIIFHTDGSITQFKDGKPYSVTSATGRVIDIQPDLGTDPNAGSRTGFVPDGVPVLINPSAAAEFHYAEAMKLWNEIVTDNFTKYTLANGTVVQTEYSADGTKPITRLFAEGARELYDANGKIEYVLAEDGEQLIDYDYDANGDLTGIHMQGSRRRLEQAVLELKVEVALQSYAALLDVARRGQVLNETVEGQYLVTRDRLLQMKAQIEAQRNKIASIKVQGKEGKGAIADAMGQINAGLGQINQALYQLLENRNQTLQNISEQVADLNQQIQTQTTQAYADIADREKEMKDSILTQEISPVVYHWYRKILGRDPSKAEYDAAKTRANYAAGTFDLVGLKTELNTSTELTERQAEVNAIRAAVRGELEYFLTLDSNARQTYFATLTSPSSGLTPPASELLVNLTSENVEAILTWLDSQSLHFGQSAYIALENLLEQAGVQRRSPLFDIFPVIPPRLGEQPSVSTFERVSLAASLILIDILTGTLTPIEKGDLILSMFAMKTYAARFGVQTEAYAMNWETLKAMFANSESQVPGSATNVVAHVDGNHFIIITDITTRTDENGNVIEEVHYTDPGAGKDGDEQVVITKEEFLKVWLSASASPLSSESQVVSPEFGYLLSPRAPPAGEAGHPALDAGSYRALSVTESMQVRGAFFGILIGLVIGIFLVGVIVQIKAVLEAIKSILHGLADILTGLVTLDFGRVWEGFKEHLFGGLQLITTLLEAPFVGLGKILEFVGVPEKIAQTFVAAGRIVAGVVLITFSPLAGPAAPLVAGYGISLAGRGAGDILRLHTNLNPQVISMIEIGAQVLGAVVGAGFGAPGAGFDFTAAIGALQSELPSLAADFASAGFVALGNHLGWDPRLTGLLNVGVSAGLKGFSNGLSLHGDWLEGIEEALQQSFAGAISFGAYLGLDALGLPSVASGFFSQLVGGWLGGAFNNGSSGGPGSSDGVPSSDEIGRNFFGRIADNIARFGQGLMNVVGNVIGLGSDLIQRGYQAVTNTFSSLFSRETQEILYQASMAGPVGAGAGWVQTSLTQNFDANDVLTSEVATYQNAAGDRMTVVVGTQTGNYTIQREMASGDFYQEVYEGVTRGSLGGIGFSSVAFAEEMADGVRVDSRFVEGQLAGVDYYNRDELKYRIVRISPGEQVLPISFTDDGVYYNIPIQNSDYTFSFTGNGFWNEHYLKDMVPELTTDFVDDMTMDLMRAGHFPIPLIGINGQPAYDGNGRLLTSANLPVTLYETTDLGENMMAWIKEAHFGSTALTQEVALELQNYFDLINHNIQYYGLDPNSINLTHFAHSGNFLPFIQAINQNPDFNIQTLISYEGPYPQNGSLTIENPNLERIIQVQGTRSPLEASLNDLFAAGAFGLGGVNFEPSEMVPFLGFREFQGTNGNVIDNIFIEIKGAGHSDFVYQVDEADPIRREISRKVNLFMRDLNAIANDGERLDLFLGTSLAITYDSNRKVYVVDPVEYASQRELE